MFGTPGKHHKRTTNPDEFDISLIQWTVYDLYTQEEIVPTVRKLFPKLRETTMGVVVG
jgi:hypothetical protein